MPRISRASFLALICLVCYVFCPPAQCQRVLVVTTQQTQPASWMSARYNGEYIVTDMTAAGLPFDVVTYGRFVSMDLGNHDLIFLSGATSPEPVSNVAAKCQTALQQGRKIFINGCWPYRRLDTNGSIIEFNEYCLSLFNVNSTGVKWLYGTPTVPMRIQKDASITSNTNFGTNGQFRTYTFNNSPAMTITVGGKAVGFLYPQGGVIDSWGDDLLNVLDYGKVASYLRYGSPVVMGFANDRIGGAPVASFEVHCDNTSNLPAIDAINQLSGDLGIPLTSLLVKNRLTSESIAAWNGLNNPLVTIGSHSRTHPWDWTLVTDFLYETRDALTDQRLLVPSTGNYFNFSGLMNPTTQQIDDLYELGVLFGGFGAELRSAKLLGQYVIIQTMPTCQNWFYNLALSTSTPYCLSLTTNDDVYSYTGGTDYEQDIQTCFEWNTKYGLYTFGYVHDFSIDPNSQRYVHGIHMSQHIRSAMECLLQRGATFIPTEQLISRLRDFMAGQITCAWNPDGSADLTVFRPNSLINEVKIGFRDDGTPIATGASILSQRLMGDHLYVTLMPETTSTIQVRWESLPPPPPEVENSEPFISNQSEVTFEGVNPSGVVEYKYAVGLTPSGTDAQGWTSTGSTARAVLSQAQFQTGQTYFISAKARYSTSEWSQPGVSNPLIADSTPPVASQIIDDGLVQVSNTHIHAVAVINDLESGIDVYQYAVGTMPGGSNTVAWMLSNQSDIDFQGLQLSAGVAYFVSCRAKNRAGSWSPVISSDGITIEPLVVGRARYFPNGTMTRLADCVITAKLPGCFYIEGLDSCAGFKVLGSTSWNEGDLVSVFGSITHVGGEPMIQNPSVDYIDIDFATVRPRLMRNRDVGGAGDSAVGGPVGGQGLNNVCLLIRTTGLITAVGSDYVYVSDGSIPGDGIGVKAMVAQTSTFHAGQYVTVTGISSLEPDGSNYRRLIKTRRTSDVNIIAQ